ncbi:uncharacterized protein METZ01_LOCUS439432, partial [marine metagenome]
TSGTPPRCKVSRLNCSSPGTATGSESPN